MRVSNKLRAFLIVVVSIVAVAVALPIMATMVKADDCTITYHANFDSDETEVLSVAQGSDVFIPKPTNLNLDNSGYCFIGWNTKQYAGPSTIGGWYFDTVPAEVTQTSLELYAVWAKQRTITLKSNDGNDGEDTQITPEGYYDKLKSNPFSRSGYDFMGWNTAADGSGTSYSDSGTVRITLEDEDLTLYAIWAKQITITFHSNNGSDTTTIQNAHAYETIKLDKNSFNSPSTDQIFSRWTLGAAGAFSNAYADEGTITLDNNIPNIDTIDNIDLYANWADICTITFEPGEGTGTPYTQEIPQQFNTALVKYADQFTAPANKEFAGWIFDETYPAADGQDVYFNISAKTFTAQWKWVQYEVTTSAGENGTITGTKSYDYETDVTITAYPADGYHVAKWVFDGTDYVNNDLTFDIPKINSNHTVEVVFEIDTFTVTAAIDSSSPAGADVSPKSAVANYGASVTLTATTPTGYHVAKWIDNGVETENTDILNIQYTITNVTDDHNVTVVFAKNVYDVGVNSDPASGCKDVTIIGTREHGTKVEVKVTINGKTDTKKDEINLAEWENNATYTFTSMYQN